MHGEGERCATCRRPFGRAAADRGRLPPHDLDAEAAVLSAALLSPIALERVTTMLAPKHFYSDANARIFETALTLAAANQPVDLVTVSAHLRGCEKLASVGGLAYIAQLADATPAVANIEAHAAIVVERHRLRSLIATCQRIAAEGYGAAAKSAAAEFIDAAEQAIFAIAQARDDAAMVSLRDSLAAVFKRISEEASGTSRPSGFRTGLGDLDGIIGLLKLGQLSIIGALSSVGKSAFAMNVATWVAEQRRDAVLVFSLEMTHEDLSTRALFSEARVSTSKLADPNRFLTAADWQALTETASRVALPNVIIDDRSDLTLLDMRAKIRRVAAQMKAAGYTNLLVIADYLQLMNGRAGLERNANREREIATLAKGLKDMAKDCDVHVMALAQLNEDGARRRDKDQKPRMSDLRESKAIGQCADKVVLIHNPSAVARSLAYRDGTTTSMHALPAEEVDLIVAKNRGSTTGTTRALFWPSYTLFTSFEPGRAGA